MGSVWRSLNALGVPREREAIVVYGPRSFISLQIPSPRQETELPG